jgi:hypothetical protein
MKTVFLRALEADDKNLAIRAAIHSPEGTTGKQRFEVDATTFTTIPRSPFAYWVGEGLLRLFKKLPRFESEGRKTKQGLATADDFRFVRCWWAVPPQHLGERWYLFAKGGKFSRFYADVYLLVNWQRSGAEIKNNLNEHGAVRSNVWMLRETAANYFLHSGLTWPRRTQGGLSIRAMPAGCIFADKGPAAFVENDNSDDLLALLAIVNAKAFRALVDLQMAFGSYEVGVIQRTPVPSLKPSRTSVLATLARRAWCLKHGLDTRTEPSHAFLQPALLQVDGDGLAARTKAWAERVRAGDAELAAIQAEIDGQCFDLYEFNDGDRSTTIDGFGNKVDESGPPDATGDKGEPDEDGEAESSADAASLGAELIAWAVGVAFGRFDVRLATGTRALPTEPDPFSPLPVCSPAMLTGDDGLPVTIAPSGYPVLFPENGILVDDRGHARDLAAAVHMVFEEVFEAKADAWWNEIGALLAPHGNDLRSWLAADFFEDHLKCYSRSRRRAPIVWQLAVLSGRYSVWLYAHRMTRDSFFQIQNDFVTPKLSHEERQLTSLVQSAGANPSVAERKQIASQEAFVVELRDLLDDVKRIAPLWNPSLDDGVVLMMAPLWRFVPQSKPWQKELKNKWSELVAGKYDWAHIAMHLWPERVVPKCATDCSLAIAHGLEDVFWAEGSDGTWSPRPIPTRPVDELVRERTSDAVKAALRGLTEASAQNGSRAKMRRSSS